MIIIPKLNILQCLILKINESRYIALFVVSRSINKLFSISCVNIYFSQSIVHYLSWSSYDELEFLCLEISYIMDLLLIISETNNTFLNFIFKPYTQNHCSSVDCLQLLMREDNPTISFTYCKYKYQEK